MTGRGDRFTLASPMLREPGRRHAREDMMIRMVVVAGLLLGSATAAPADGSCRSNAADKKLAGAAMNSFMKKCQTDAAKLCDDQSAAKKLAGAARTSFTKKCVNDAVGT